MTNAAPATRNETSDVRDAHRFDVGALQAYLKRYVDGFHGTLEVRQFVGGQSNPTFLLAAGGRDDYGKPGNYFARQIGRWTKQYEAAKTDHVEAMDNLIAWLPTHIPPGDETCIAHGDFRLENSIYHPTEPRMIAVLDWELSTLGHPLADLAYNCMLYHVNSPTQGTLMNLDYEAVGIPSEADYVAAYCRRTGRPGVEHWEFYVAFALFRLASIAQGVYKRGLDGNASSTQASMYGAVCAFLSGRAWEMVAPR